MFAGTKNEPDILYALLHNIFLDISLEQIAKAQEIVDNHNNKVIKDHQAQVMVQMAVFEVQHCMYFIGQSGTREASRRIT